MLMSILVAFVIMLPWQTHQKFLSNYKSLIFDDPKKVVLLDHDSYSNGESGPLRLISARLQKVRENNYFCTIYDRKPSNTIK